MMMYRPDEDIAWIHNVNRLPLFASWEPQTRRGVRALLKKLRPREPALGWLCVEGWSLRLTLHYVRDPLEVMLDAPLVAHLSRAPGGDEGCEINLGIRNVDAPLGTPWLQVRSVWPRRHLGTDVPHKQEHAPFVSPHHVRRLCGAIRALVEINGGQWTGDIDLSAGAMTLERLRSRTPATCCVSCQSPHIIAIAAEAYRCGECGYEGGNGLPAFLLELELRDFRRQSKEEQRSTILFHIEETLAALRAALAYWIPEGGLEQVRVERLRVQRHLMAVQLHLIKLSHKHPNVQTQAQAHAAVIRGWAMVVRPLDNTIQQHIRRLRDDLRGWRFEVEVEQTRVRKDPTVAVWDDTVERAIELLNQAQHLLQQAPDRGAKIHPDTRRELLDALGGLRRVVAGGAQHLSPGRVAALARDVAQVEALEAHYRVTRQRRDEHVTLLQRLRERMQQG